MELMKFDGMIQVADEMKTKMKTMMKVERSRLLYVGKERLRGSVGWSDGSTYAKARLWWAGVMRGG